MIFLHYCRDQRLHLNQHRQHTRSAEKSARRNYQDLRKQQLSEPLLYFWKPSTCQLNRISIVSLVSECTSTSTDVVRDEVWSELELELEQSLSSDQRTWTTRSFGGTWPCLCRAGIRKVWEEWNVSHQKWLAPSLTIMILPTSIVEQSRIVFLFVVKFIE